jgi:hypothetical protein
MVARSLGSAGKRQGAKAQELGTGSIVAFARPSHRRHGCRHNQGDASQGSDCLTRPLHSSPVVAL